MFRGGRLRCLPYTVCRINSERIRALTVIILSLPVQQTWVQPPVREDPTNRGAAKALLATTAEPTHSRACAPGHKALR